MTKENEDVSTQKTPSGSPPHGGNKEVSAERFFATPGHKQDGTERTPSGIPGLDELLGGGAPVGRAMLVSGTAGTGKTLAGIHFAIDGAKAANSAAVFVSFEESSDQLRRTIGSLGRNAEALEADGKLILLDVLPSHLTGGEHVKEMDDKPVHSEDVVLDDTFDLGGLLARIINAARKINADRVVIDSLAGLAANFIGGDVLGANRFDPHFALRPPLRQLIDSLKRAGLTTLLTGERQLDDGPVSRFGIDEFVTDGVLLLRNSRFGERRRRTIEIKKLRSCAHVDGESPFVIRAGRGMAVLAVSSMQLTQQSGVERTTTGVAELDRMTDGGLMRDSVVLVSGATGLGKTLLCNHFVAGGAGCGEKSLFLAFEESEEQLFRNAAAFGMDLASEVKAERLVLESLYPEALGLEEHLLRIQEVVEREKPRRLVIDSLSALERIGPPFAFRQFLIGLAAFVKQNRVTTLLTAGGGTLGDAVSISEQHISTLTDTIIMLRYIDTQGRMERALTLLKMRGSVHAREHRRYRIDDAGMQLAGPKGDASRLRTGEIELDTSAAPAAKAVDR